MPDDIDRASDLEAALLTARVAHAQRLVQPVAEPARECCDCGATLTEQRRRTMTAPGRCVPCQRAWEMGR